MFPYYGKWRSKAQQKQNTDDQQGIADVFGFICNQKIHQYQQKNSIGIKLRQLDTPAEQSFQSAGIFRRRGLWWGWRRYIRKNRLCLLRALAVFKRWLRPIIRPCATYIAVIQRLSPPQRVKGSSCSLGHVGHPKSPVNAGQTGIFQIGPHGTQQRDTLLPYQIPLA